MADALGSDTSLLGSTTSGYTYGGSASKKKRKGLIIALVVITILIAGIIAVIYVAGDVNSSSSTPTPPPTESYLLHGSHISVSQIEAISTYRSSVGGDFPGYASWSNTNQTCGSFQHYLRPFPDLDFTKVTVYSPVDGTILRNGITNSNPDNASWGSDIIIEAYTDASHEYLITLRYVITNLTGGTTVRYGNSLGYHAGSFVEGSPIAIMNYTSAPAHYVSMFNVMDETELKRFQEVNITNRSYPIISDHQRNTYPLNCTDPDGLTQYGPIANDSNNGYPYPNWIYTNNTSPAKRTNTKKTNKKKLKY